MPKKDPLFFELQIARSSQSEKLWQQKKGTSTHPETNSSPLKLGFPKRKLIFQPSIFRGYVSFREGIAEEANILQIGHVLHFQ